MVGDRDGYRGAPRGNCQELREEIKAAPGLPAPPLSVLATLFPVAFYLSGTSQWLASADKLRVTVSPESKRSLWPFFSLSFSRHLTVILAKHEHASTRSHQPPPLSTAEIGLCLL